ncbi:MAG: TatD family nuclease-associated radical SAM protein [Clostridia bacterium]
MNTLTYKYNNKVYINLTNECSNCCQFCIRNNNDGVADYYLWLSTKPTADEVLADLKSYDWPKYREAVFCGFGEPLYALDLMITAAKYLKSVGVKTRLNTNGQASLICGSGVAEKLVGKLDVVSISLNASNAKKYNEICNCCFGEEGYNSMLDFARDCIANGIHTVFSVVDTIGKEEVEKCRLIAESIGAEYRVREYIKAYESENKI